MSADTGLTKDKLFQIGKYTIYFLILINTVYYLYEDFTASAHTFRDGVSLAEFTDAFATFVDSMSWFILLVIFELETFVISDQTLRGRLKWWLNGLIAISYGFIILAFTGYVDKAEMTYGFEQLNTKSACEMVGTYQSYAIELDEYDALTPQSCMTVTETSLYGNPDVSILSEDHILSDMKRLSMTDVVNAGTWIAIVLVLWADILLQLGGGLTARLYRLNVYVKAILYSILIVACAYWFWLEIWVDGWDALLWILAFFAIELNLFKWQEETNPHQPHEAVA